MTYELCNFDDSTYVLNALKLLHKIKMNSKIHANDLNYNFSFLRMTLKSK